jgi:hypothetical protein
MSGAGYSGKIAPVRPAALRAIQRWLSGKAHTIALLSGPQFQRLLVLFTAFITKLEWLYQNKTGLSRF